MRGHVDKLLLIPTILLGIQRPLLDDLKGDRFGLLDDSNVRDCETSALLTRKNGTQPTCAYKAAAG